MKFVFIILASCLITACAPIAPGNSNIKALTSDNLDLNAIENYQWPSENWWQLYEDEQLNELVRQALKNSPKLDIAKAKIDQAQSGLAAAKAIQWPQINANYQLNRQLYSENYIYPPPLGGAYATENNLNLQLSFDLDLWQHNKSLVNSANYQKLAATAEAEQSKLMLISAIAQNYFQLQNANNQAKGISEIVDKLAEALKITQDRYDNGLGNQVDVNQAKSALAAAKVQLSQARENARLLHNNLAELSGKSANQLNQLKRIELNAKIIELPDVLPMQLLGRRADIQAAKFITLASEAEVSAAKADFYPNINLTAIAGFMSLGLDNLLRNNSKTYGIGPIISLPIFNAGQLNAQLNAKRAQQDIAVAQYNETVLRAAREVSNAITSINALNSQIEQQSQSLIAINSAATIALARYKAGLGNFIQVLMAQNEALKQTILSTDLFSRAYILNVQLNTALGGGYTNTESNNF